MFWGGLSFSMYPDRLYHFTKNISFWGKFSFYRIIIIIMIITTGLQIFFKIGGPKWPVEQKMVGHFLKWWAQAYQTNLKYTLPTHWHRHLYEYMYIDCWLYSKTCLKGHLKMKINYRLMLVKSIAECSKGSILQSFWPSLNYHLLLRSLFCLFLSGCLRLYWQLFCAVRRLTVRWIFFLLKWDFCTT